ncbi:MAG: hypothetical protein M4579_003755 [Chaenotheca gracillima]|nr:MAG: hypothetical protein M4579_003755 [Chaenotheca gracillima]
MEAPPSPRQQRSSLLQLPNELIIYIFSCLPTRVLLPVTSVSHRFHDIILRILHHRLLLAASLKDQRVILECYHPSAQYFAPQLSCTYLGTDGLSDQIEGEGSIYQDVEKTGRLGKLAGLYSRFRPVKPSEEGRVYWPHPAGDVPGHPNTSTQYPTGPLPAESTDQRSGAAAMKGVELVTQIVTLDSHELFSQLCTVTSLVRDAPRRGLFHSFVTIGEAVVRVWRTWLAEQARHTSAISAVETEVNGRLTNDQDPAKRMLWFDSSQNLGLLLRVRERQWRRPQPILMHRDEEQPVSYFLDYEEFLIRTTQLLLRFEESQSMDDPSGKAIVFGSFR